MRTNRELYDHVALPSSNRPLDAFAAILTARPGRRPEGEDLVDLSFLSWDELAMFVSCGRYHE